MNWAINASERADLETVRHTREVPADGPHLTRDGLGDGGDGVRFRRPDLHRVAGAPTAEPRPDFTHRQNGLVVLRHAKGRALGFEDAQDAVAAVADAHVLVNGVVGRGKELVHHVLAQDDQGGVAPDFFGGEIAACPQGVSAHRDEPLVPAHHKDVGVGFLLTGREAPHHGAARGNGGSRRWPTMAFFE